MNASRLFSAVLCLAAFGTALASAQIPATLPADVPSTSPTTLPATAPSTLPTTLPNPEVDALIARLGGDDWRDRQKAEDRLVELGDEARAALAKAAAEIEGTERRTRAAVALARIDEIARNGPTLITLHLKDVNPSQVVAELSRQSGAPINTWPPEQFGHPRGGGGFGAGPKVTIDVDRQPFWLAVAAFCDKANVRVVQMGFNDGITFMQGGSAELNAPQCPSGQFLVIASGAQRNRSVTFGPAGGRQDFDSLSLRVYADPKAKVLQYASEAEVTEALDDKGKSMGTHKAVASGMVGTPGRSYTFAVNVPLTYADDGYTKLARLKGTVQVLLASKTQTLEIPDMEKALNAPVAAAGRTVEVKQANLAGNNFNYRLVIHRAGMPLEQWHNLFNDIQGIHFTDATGNVRFNGGGGSLNDSECQTSGSFSGGAGIKGPIKMVWEMTTETKLQPVPFEFKDLPLPTP